MTIRSVLFPLPDSDDLRGSVDALQQLQSILLTWEEALRFGPVPGSYVPFFFTHQVEAGLSAVQPVDAVPLWGDARPVFAGAWCDTGTLTLTLRDASSDTISFQASSTPVSYNARGDFSVETVADALYLDIDSIDSGTPTKLRAILVCKNLQRVEP